MVNAAHQSNAARSDDREWQTSQHPIEVEVAASGDEWDSYVHTHEDGTVEHLWGWQEVYRRAFGHDTVYLVARRDRKVVGVLPVVRYRSLLFGRFCVSLPYSNYAGIVADDPDAEKALMSKALELARAHGAAHVEFRHRDRRLHETVVTSNKVGFSRPLPRTTEELWSSLDRKVRNQVRKAQKAGLEVVSGGRELLPRFYPVFAENMRDLGTPVFPVELFFEAVRVFGERTQVFVVSAGSAPAAAGIALTFRDTVLVPWASSLRAFRQQCPNMLLYWSIMEWAVQNGFTTFDFGRSTAGAGTAQFKEQWGGQPRQLHTEYLLLKGDAAPNQGTSNKKLAPAIAFWQRLPLAVANRIGPVIIKQLP